MYIYIFTVLEHTQDSYYANVPTGLELGLYHILIRYVVISVYLGHCLLHHRRRLPLRKTRRRNGFGVSVSLLRFLSQATTLLCHGISTRECCDGFSLNLTKRLKRFIYTNPYSSQRQVIFILGYPLLL